MMQVFVMLSLCLTTAQATMSAPDNHLGTYDMGDLTKYTEPFKDNVVILVHKISINIYTYDNKRWGRET